MNKDTSANKNSTGNANNGDKLVGFTAGKKLLAGAAAVAAAFGVSAAVAAHNNEINKTPEQEIIATVQVEAQQDDTLWSMTKRGADELGVPYDDHKIADAVEPYRTKGVDIGDDINVSAVREKGGDNDIVWLKTNLDTENNK